MIISDERTYTRGYNAETSWRIFFTSQRSCWVCIQFTGTHQWNRVEGDVERADFPETLYIYIYAHEEDSWGRINRISDCGIECKYLRIRYFNVIPNLKRCCVKKSRDLIIWNNLRNDLRKSTFWYFVCHMKMIASIKISYYIHRVLREKSITKVQMSSFPRSNATRQQVII